MGTINLQIRIHLLRCCCCCFASPCLAEQTRSPLKAISWFVPWVPKQSPGCAAPGQMVRSRRGGGDFARLRLESEYIHRGEAPLIDVASTCWCGWWTGVRVGWQGCSSVISFNSKHSRKSVDIPVTCHPPPCLITFAFR